MLANKNCKWLELPLPLEDWATGMKDTVQITADGEALAPMKPGLGYEVDEEAVRRLTIETI